MAEAGTADMFGGTLPTVSGITAEGVKMTFSSALGDTKSNALVIQDIDLQYSQQVSQLYALDISTMFLSAGRPQGRLTLHNLVGPGSSLGTLVRTYGNVCKVDGAFNLSMATTCRDAKTSAKEGTAGADTSVTVNAPLITTVGLSGNAQDFKIIGALEATFSGMMFK